MTLAASVSSYNPYMMGHPDRVKMLQGESLGERFHYLFEVKDDKNV